MFVLGTQKGKFSQFEKHFFLGLPLAVAIARVFTRQRRTEQEVDKVREQSRGGEQRRRAEEDFFFALCCLGMVPGGAPFSQLHKSGNGSRVDRP